MSVFLISWSGYRTDFKEINTNDSFRLKVFYSELSGVFERWEHRKELKRETVQFFMSDETCDSFCNLDY